MGKKRIASKLNEKGGKRIPPPHIDQESVAGPSRPAFSFRYLDTNHYLLQEWSQQEIALLTDKLKQFESYTWSELFAKHPLGFEGPIDHYKGKLPPTIDFDADLYSFRVTQKARVYGTISNGLFCIIRFDRNHETCPFDP